MKNGFCRRLFNRSWFARKHSVSTKNVKHEAAQTQTGNSQTQTAGLHQRVRNVNSNQITTFWFGRAGTQLWFRGEGSRSVLHSRQIFPAQSDTTGAANERTQIHILSFSEQRPAKHLLLRQWGVRVRALRATVTPLGRQGSCCWSGRGRE